MPSEPPIDFEAKARQPIGPSGGAPMQISAGDLMKNFVFATLQLPDALTEEVSGKNGHNARKLQGPTTGTHVLGIVDREIQWIATEAC